MASNSYKTPDLYAATPAGTVARNVNLRQPTDEISIYGLFDYALTKDQTLRVTFNRYAVSNGNQGVGTYDCIGRAYSTESATQYPSRAGGRAGREKVLHQHAVLHCAGTTVKRRPSSKLPRSS